MKKILFLICSLTLVWVSCRKDIDNTDITIVDPIPTKYVKAVITGQVVNEAGQAVTGAAVHLGDKTVQTDAYGVFYFAEDKVNGNGAYIRVEHPQYFHGSRTIIVLPNTRNTVKIRLLSNVVTKNLNAASGGTAEYGDYSVSLPAGGIKTSTGASYSGSVGVAAKWLNPSANEFVEMMPGRLVGVRTDNSGSGMVSLGMLAVELTDGAGNALNIKEGFEASIRMKVPDNMLSKAPQRIPLWSFNEDSGVWVEEGEANLINGFYEGKVKHFTFWNCDYPNPLVEVDFNVIDQNGNPIEGARVVTILPSTGAYGFGFTDNTGHIVGLVPQNEALEAKVFGPFTSCNIPLLTEAIGPFSQNSTHTFTVSFNGVYDYNISGQLLDCNGAPLSEGYVRVVGFPGFIWADAQGNFQTTVSDCQQLSSLTIIGYDIDNLKSSQPATFTINNGMVDAGVINVCDALQEYLVYNFPPNQKITLTDVSSTYDDTSGSTNPRLIIGGKTTSFSIRISLDQFTGTGTYQPSTVFVDGFYMGLVINHYCGGWSNPPCTGFTLTITEYTGIGGYVSGVYSGMIFNSATGTDIPVFGSFRTPVD
jgi:hypothetical protein